jgi:hypothetical protein
MKSIRKRAPSIPLPGPKETIHITRIVIKPRVDDKPDQAWLRGGSRYREARSDLSPAPLWLSQPSNPANGYFSEFKISNNILPSVSGIGCFSKCAMVGAISMFLTIPIFSPRLIPWPEAIKRAFIFGLVARYPW